MSKKTLLLILFLFLITCGLLYLALITTPTKPTAPLVPTPTPLSINAKTLLGLSVAPASQSSTLTQYTLSVTIDTTTNMVNAAQLELSYDPQALTSVSVSPGDFLTSPNVLLKNINVTDGRISYALTQPVSTPGKSGKGNVAFISFNINPTFINSTTTISFLPKTAVAADKILESVLRKATGITLTLPTLHTTQGSSPSGTTNQPSVPAQPSQSGY